MLSSIWQLMEQSWHLYGANLKKFIPLMLAFLLVSLPANLYSLLTAPTYQAFANLSKNQQSTYTLILCIVSLALFFIALVFLKQMYYAWIKKETSLGDIVMSTFPVAIPALVVALITSLTMVFGLFFLSVPSMILIIPAVVLLIPGLWLFVYLFFGYFYTLFDETGIVESLKKSWHLVSGRWRAVAERILLPALLIGVLSSCITAILRFLFIDTFALAVFNVSTASTVLIIRTIIDSIIAVVFFPWVSYCTIILFFELKKTPHV
jgi:hypothetical protein